jgi:hypothetical protein
LSIKKRRRGRRVFLIYLSLKIKTSGAISKSPEVLSSGPEKVSSGKMVKEIEAVTKES